MREKIIIDCDTGTDDAVALVLAMLSDEFEVLGITTVNGNIEVKLSTDNSLRVVECCGKEKEVKVYRGADLPLVSTLSPYTAQARYPLPHREGMYRKDMIHTLHLPLKEAKIKEETIRAVPWLVDILNNSIEPITILAIGPLTNIALALRSDERIISKIKRIVLMGGGHQEGNATPAAEFNIFADPEAAEIVFQSGIDITVIPLDATYKATINMQQANKFKDIDTPPAILIYEMFKHRINAYTDNYSTIQNACPLHDPLALCAISHSEVLKDVIDTNCHVDIGNSYGYGATIVDFRNKKTGEKANCHYALNCDKDFFVDWMLEILRKDKERNSYD